MISSVYAEEEVVKAAHGSGAGERLFLASDGLLLRVYEWKSSGKPLTADADPCEWIPAFSMIVGGAGEGEVGAGWNSELPVG